MPQNPTRVKHLLFGPDGHRRWAYLNKKSLKDSYRGTSKTLINIIEWGLSEKGYVDELTLWLHQERNLEREPEEARILVEAVAYWVKDICGSKVVKDLDIQICIIGELDSFSKNFEAEKLEILSDSSKVKGHKGKKVNILVAYNGSKELNRAIQRCREKGLEIDFGNISDNWSIPKLNLFMRTGQPRNFNNISDYFPGIERARLVGTPTYPQELTKKEFDRTIKSFLTLKDSYKRMVNKF